VFPEDDPTMGRNMYRIYVGNIIVLSIYVLLDFQSNFGLMDRDVQMVNTKLDSKTINCKVKQAPTTAHGSGNAYWRYIDRY